MLHGLLSGLILAYTISGSRAAQLDRANYDYSRRLNVKGVAQQQPLSPAPAGPKCSVYGSGAEP